MHELAVCQSLIAQVEQTLQAHQPCNVERILVKIGPLSGIEADLLLNAFSIAKMGTLAEKAVLQIEHQDIMVHCTDCGQDFKVKINNLSCPECGNWRTRLISGNEMLLQSIELKQE